MMFGCMVRNGRVDCHNVPLAFVIGRAYRLKALERISNPDWMNVELYDIQAKAAGEATEEQLMLMLQGLLAERFELKFHRAQKPSPIYSLGVAKGGPKLQESKEGEVGSVIRRGSLSHKNATMERLAQILSGLIGRPVVDASGIKGTYHIELSWDPEDIGENQVAMMTRSGLVTSGAAGPSIFPALERQLGLRLTAEQGVVEELVVDSARKVPIEN